MDPSQMTQQQLIMYAVLFNTAIGFVLGLFPLIIGFVKGRVKYGLLGMAASVLGGAILGIILSVPAALIFSWLAYRGTKGAQRDDGSPSDNDLSA
jgi:hypothetical protein